jgi:Undecaprenyl-phosphate glucose phosphotransferase
MLEFANLESNSVAGNPALLSDGQASQVNTPGLLPFTYIQPVAFFSDLVIIVGTSVLTGMAYHILFFQSFGSVPTFLGIGVLIYINFSAILAARGAYRPQNLAIFPKQARETVAVWLFVFLLLSLVAFSLKVSDEYSRGATIAFFTLGLSAITIWRFFIARFISRALAEGTFAQQKFILIAEEGQLAGSHTVNELKRCGYMPIRTFEYAPSAGSSFGGSSRLFALIEEIIKVSRQEMIESVFLLVSWDDRSSVEQLMELLRVLSVPIYLLPDRNVAHFIGGRVVNIGTVWTAELKRAPLTIVEQACKRILDLMIASTVLVLLSPIMLLTAVLIKLDGHGPIFFMQTRNGFNGRPFRMRKFRTMSVLEDGPIIRQVKKDDPRVTRFGRLLRRANIDELPQLLNVIAGDMSLVGPRPQAAAHNTEYEKIIANYAFRYHVKPGITGWAQVNGLRGETQTVDLMAQRVEFDLWYINNWSLWLDFRILLRTLTLGLQHNAY